ncbi:hypothetical protein E3Q07_04055 [Wallemia mellicola]|nr:hypothetical protein E3Q07_04055 [Wallemia mellicola]
MLGANLGPTGIIPNINISGLIFITETIALLQILVELLSLFSLMLNYPIKFFSGFKQHKLRIGVLYFTGTLALGVYQAVDGGVYMLISATIYQVLLYIHKAPRDTSDSSIVNPSLNLLHPIQQRIIPLFYPSYNPFFSQLFNVPPFNRIRYGPEVTQSIKNKPKADYIHFKSNTILDNTRVNASLDDTKNVANCLDMASCPFAEVYNLSLDDQHDIKRRQNFDDGKYHGVGSLSGSRDSTTPPDAQVLPNDADSSTINSKSTSNVNSDNLKSSSSSDNVEIENIEDEDDLEDDITTDSDGDDNDIEKDEEIEIPDAEDDSDLSDDRPDSTIPPSNSNDDEATASISDTSPDFKVAYLSPIFIIGGLVALFTIVGLIYRRRRRNRLAREREMALENGSSEDMDSHLSKSVEANVFSGNLEEEPRHSSWQTNDDAEMMSPNTQAFIQASNARLDRPWTYQPSGLSPQSFRNEPWKWPSNHTPKDVSKPLYHHTNSSFQPPSQITDEFLKSPLPEGYQDASPEDIDRNFVEMGDRKKYNSGSMAFYSNAMKSVFDGERKKSGSIGKKFLSRKATAEMDNGQGPQIRQRKVSDKQAQQISENDDNNFISSAFSPPLRSSTPWWEISQAVKTVFNPPKREPTPAFGGFFKRSSTPANPLVKEMQTLNQNESEPSEENVLTPISKDIKSPVPISYDQIKSESNSTDETQKMEMPPPPLPKSPNKKVKREKKKSESNKHTFSPTSPIVMNAVMDQNIDLTSQHKLEKGKEKIPHSPLLEQLARSPVPLSPKFAELSNRDENSDFEEDGPEMNDDNAHSQFYTVKDMKNIRDEFSDEAAKLREMAITPFVKGQGSTTKGISEVVSSNMKESQSQLTPPGLCPETQVQSPQQQDATLSQLPFAQSPQLGGKKTHPPSWSLEAQVPRVVSPPPNAISPQINISSPPLVSDWHNLPETLRSPPPQAVRSEMIFQANANQAGHQSITAALTKELENQNKNEDVGSEVKLEDEPEVETWSEGSGSTVFYEDETYQDDGIINIGRSNTSTKVSSQPGSVGAASTRSKIRRYKTRRSAMSTSTRYRNSQTSAPNNFEENSKVSPNNNEQQRMVVDDWKKVESNRNNVSASTEVHAVERNVKESPIDEQFASPLNEVNESPKRSDDDFKSPKSDDFKSSKSNTSVMKSPLSSDFLPTIEATPELARSSTMKNYLMRLPSIKQATGMGSIDMNAMANDRLPSPAYNSYESGNYKYNFIGKGQGNLESPQYSSLNDQDDSNKALAKVDEILTSSWSSRISSDDLEEAPPRRRGAAVAPRTRKLLEARMRRERSESPTSSIAENEQ